MNLCNQLQNVSYKLIRKGYIFLAETNILSVIYIKSMRWFPMLIEETTREIYVSLFGNIAKHEMKNFKNVCIFVDKEILRFMLQWNYQTEMAEV